MLSLSLRKESNLNLLTIDQLYYLVVLEITRRDRVFLNINFLIGNNVL